MPKGYHEWCLKWTLHHSNDFTLDSNDKHHLIKLKYKGDLNTGLVSYSNGQK